MAIYWYHDEFRILLYIWGLKRPTYNDWKYLKCLTEKLLKASEYTLIVHALAMNFYCPDISPTVLSQTFCNSQFSTEYANNFHRK